MKAYKSHSSVTRIGPSAIGQTWRPKVTHPKVAIGRRQRLLCAIEFCLYVQHNPVSILEQFDDQRQTSWPNSVCATARITASAARNNSNGIN